MSYHYPRLRRPITDQTRDAVIDDFSAIEKIADLGIRNGVIEAWAHALSCSGFRRISNISPDGNPGSPVLKVGTQADHVRGVFRYAKIVAQEFADLSAGQD